MEGIDITINGAIHLPHYDKLIYHCSITDLKMTYFDTVMIKNIRVSQEELK